MVGFHKVSKLVVLGSLLLAGTCVQAMEPEDPIFKQWMNYRKDRSECSPEELNPPEQTSQQGYRYVRPSASVTPELADKLASRKLRSEPQRKENIPPALLRAVITLDPFKNCLSSIDEAANKNLKQVNWNLYRCSKAQVTSFSFHSYYLHAKGEGEYVASMKFIDKSLPAYINLKHLRLDATRISSDTLRKFGKLESLSLGEEHGVTNADLASLSHISSLSLMNMDAITNEGLSPLTNLKSLSLRAMENVPNEGLSPLTNLKSLSLMGVRKVNNEGFSHLTNLTDLTLSYMCHLTGSCLSHLSALETLKLDGVPIEEYHVYLCSQQLQKLDINYTGKFTGEYIQFLPLLAYLNCSGAVLQAPAGAVLDEEQRNKIEGMIELHSQPPLLPLLDKETQALQAKPYYESLGYITPGEVSDEEQESDEEQSNRIE